MRSEAAAKDLDSEQRASLSTQLLSVDFLEDQRSAILALLNGESRPKKNRRDGQHAIHAFEYFSAAEWSRLESKFQPPTEELIIDVLVRMQCINPTEPTVKLLTSGIRSEACGKAADWQ